MTPDEAANGMAKGLEVAKEYADLVVKPPLEELGGILSDTVGHWRLKNRINLLLKTKKFLEAKGIRPEKLMPSVFVPLLEEAGNTDDPDLSEMFARLLATQLDPQTQSTVHPSFAKVLGQLSPLDAKVLRVIDEKEKVDWESTRGDREPNLKWPFYFVVEYCHGKIIDARMGQIALSVHNLIRLGLCVDNGLGISDDVKPAGIHMTHFGKRFMSAITDYPHPGREYSANHWDGVRTEK